MKYLHFLHRHRLHLLLDEILNLLRLLGLLQGAGELGHQPLFQVGVHHGLPETEMR